MGSSESQEPRQRQEADWGNGTGGDIPRSRTRSRSRSFSFEFCCENPGNTDHGETIQTIPWHNELSRGDTVHVWNATESKWIKDVVVQEGTAVDMVVGGATVPAGSLMVRFSRGGTQWITPWATRDLLRKVPRPQAMGVTPRPKVAGAVAEAAEANMLVELRQVEECCKVTGHSFKDGRFAMHTLGAVTAWLRPHEIQSYDGRVLSTESRLADWRLFRGPPQADDVQQGQLGDCWFLSSLAALAEFQEGRFVRALFPDQRILCPAGSYVVRLCLGGMWRGVLIDDRLPCKGGVMYYTQLTYCVTNNMQLWASLIEKAFAKACGSYDAISGGESSEALEMLTGWPCMMLIFERPDFDPEILWATLCSSRDAAFLMTCSTKAVRTPSLEPDHVYSLMDVSEVEVEAAGSEGTDTVRLLKLRNPNSKTKWQGAWSDSSPLWTKELRRLLGFPEGGDPHVFFMALEDFLEQFAHCTICRIRSEEWHEAREPTVLPSGDVPCMGMVVRALEITECSISLAQPEERLRRGELFSYLHGEPAACIGFVVLEIDERASVKKVVATAQLRRAAAVSVDCWLQPGRYLLVPLSLHSGTPVPATWACVSSKRVKLTEKRLDNKIVRNAWAAYAKECDPKGEHFHGGVLHLGSSGEGGSMVVFAENHGRGHFNVELLVKTDCLSFSRGRAQTSDWLPPGYGQILQVARPLAPHPDAANAGPVSWHRQTKFQMMGRPNLPMHSPLLETALSVHVPFPLTGGPSPPHRKESS